MEKEFRTIKEQIDLLKSRNLTINNEENAINILKNNNNYYLINGYKNIFLDTSKKEKYIDGTKLEDVYNLYEFDRKIRIIFLEYILLIERKIDTYIAYEFSKEYGHKDYLTKENFDCNQKNEMRIVKLLEDINLEILHQYKNSNKMIVHYLDNYHYIPLWVLVRILSFGKVSKLYSFMKPKEKNNVSRNFNIKSEVLRIYLTNLGEIRNICAHDEKLYDVNLRFKISSNNYHSILKIEGTKGNYKKGVKDLFSIVLILKDMLEKEQFNMFFKLLIKNIEFLKKEMPNGMMNKVMFVMGFPKNYEKLLKI